MYESPIKKYNYGAVISNIEKTTKKEIHQFNVQRKTKEEEDERKCIPGITMHYMQMHI